MRKRPRRQVVAYETGGGGGGVAFFGAWGQRLTFQSLDPQDAWLMIGIEAEKLTVDGKSCRHFAIKISLMLYPPFWRKKNPFEGWGLKLRQKA